MTEKRSSRQLTKLKEIWRRFKKNKSAMIGLIILIVILVVAILGPILIPYEKVVKQNAADRLQSPNMEHWFGTDAFGRDYFARIVHAAPTSLFIGLSVSIIGLIAGGAIGITCAYFGGAYDEIMMRFIDILSSIPGTLLSLVVVAVLGPNMRNMIIAMAIARVRADTRISRSAALGTTSNEYVEAAIAGGSSHFRIILKHIVPNIMATLIVTTTLSVAGMILHAAGLSFLGLGVQPPTPEWGSMLNEARQFMRGSSYLMIIPGLAIMLSALSINLIGDGLRDALDPKLKN